MGKKRFYVVWNGLEPGIYDSWDKCKISIQNYKGAIYKSFNTLEEAQLAFNDSPQLYIGKTSSQKHSILPIQAINEIVKNSLAVDAACSGNPGLLEYRGVYTKTGEQLFHQGPFKMGTNNIGEFLALVHGLALFKQKKINLPIYSDSVIAIKWVSQKKCRTKLERLPENQELFDLVNRAESWLNNNEYDTKIMKWQTKKWGEIPADFGRK